MSQLDRRTFLLSTGLIGAAAALSACSGSPDTPTSTGGAPAVSTGKLSGTVTLTTWGSDQEVAAFKKIAAAFTAARGRRGQDRGPALRPDPHGGRPPAAGQPGAGPLPRLVHRRQRATPRTAPWPTSATTSVTASASVLPRPVERGAASTAPRSGCRTTPTPRRWSTTRRTSPRPASPSVPTTLETAWTWEELVDVLEQAQGRQPRRLTLRLQLPALRRLPLVQHPLPGRRHGARRRRLKTSTLDTDAGQEGARRGPRASTPRACTRRASSSSVRPIPTRSSRPRRSR